MVHVFRVVVQNERYEDWTPTVIELKRMFVEYPDRVLKYHNSEGLNVPEASNSSAAQGNFLQVLNMALNGISCHHCHLPYSFQYGHPPLLGIK